MLVACVSVSASVCVHTCECTCTSSPTNLPVDGAAGFDDLNCPRVCVHVSEPTSVRP